MKLPHISIANPFRSAQSGGRAFLIAENELEKRAVFCEVKRNPSQYSESVLRRKADAFLRETGAFSGYRIDYRPWTLSNLRVS